MTRALPVLVLSVLAGCTETILLRGNPLQDIVSIEISPPEATITLTDLAPPFHTIQYSAMGRFSDGSARDVSDLVSWSLDNTLIGSADARGLFTASHVAGGRAVLSASASGVTAEAPLTVVIDTVIIDPASPPPAAGLFSPGSTVITGGPNAPALVYPADQTMFPQGVASTLFQYTRGSANNDAFRLTFDSAVLHLVIETGADRWSATGALQMVIAGSGQAGPIRTDVRATASASSGTVYASSPINIDYAADSPRGPIYYWSAATNGVMRGGLDLIAASSLYPSTTTTCVGCHAVARSGGQMAMAYDTASNLQTIYLPSLATQISATNPRPVGWSSYSPDGSMLLVANNGILTLLDAQTGAPIGGDGRVPLPPMRYATHPDWSPDGTYVAVALTSTAPTNMDVKSASIARIAYNNGAWGSPVVLVAGSASSNNYFPRWSPDGRYLAYVNATSSSRGAQSAKLMLVDGAGGAPRELRSANARVDTRELNDLSNTMPTWSAYRGDRAWLTFVSARPYGVVMPVGRGQIWLAAIDLEASGDPSSAAFWLPCQDATVLNNNPVWSGDNLTQ